MSDKTTLTYSSLRQFMNCRRKFYWRFIACLVRIGYVVQALQFGSAVHEGLHRWRTLGILEDVLSVPITSELAAYYVACMRAYTRWYAEESFTVLASEEPFTATIINPKTGQKSRSFIMRGRIDARTEDLIIEHKTTASASQDYLERLWTDRQIMLYTLYLRQNGHDIRGVLYDIIEKTTIRQRKNEGPVDFLGRLNDQYANGQKFHRELLYFSDDDLAQVQWEVWELTQQILDCRRRGVWYQNPSHCFHWNRACQYYPICRSNDNPIVIENQYEYREPHEELNDEQWSPTSDASDKADTTKYQTGNPDADDLWPAQSR